MSTFLMAIGWWNLVGSVLMFGIFQESFGKLLLNDWTKIFKVEFKLDFYGRFWCIWALGLNIFFALINIMAAHWGYTEVMY